MVVTGAASGIGRATAARLLEEGARVLGADIAPTEDRPALDGDAATPGPSPWST